METESAYEIFMKSGNKNIFEEVIDKLMLEKYSENPEIIDFIDSLPLEKKRIAILSLLGDDNNLWNKIRELLSADSEFSFSGEGKAGILSWLGIKGLSNKEINRLDHIKNVLTMLREYVKVGEVEKKKFGEVMTPLELVKEMMSTLPDEVWSNPNLKWLDPANGTGPYPAWVIYRLMVGLKDWEPDEEKRYRHIVENMIYVCELQPKNMFLYMCAVDPFDTYKLNVYTGSFLDEGFDYHMKEVWGIDKFDIVIGNPPYQLENKSEKTKTSSNVKLWRIFIENSIRMISKNGYLIFVTPSSWASGTKNPHNSTNLFNDIFKNLNTIHISFDVNKYFKGIGVDFTYFLIQNCPYKGNTFFNEGHFLDISKLDLLPKLIDPDVISIIRKIEKADKMNFIMDRKDHYKNSFSKTEDSKYCNQVYCGPKIGFIYSDKYSPFMKNRKIFTHRVSTMKMIPDNTGEISTNYSQVLLLTEEENAEFAKNLFSTKLYKFLFNLFKYTQYNEKINLNQLPKVDLKISWTDEMLFEYFELSKKEIEIISKNI